MSDDLLSRFDVLLVDLDGTLYAGPSAVPGAVEAIATAQDRGVRTSYVTNNASRRPSDVAAHLAELGFPATTEDVRTSSQAGAAMLAAQLPEGARVLVVGTSALAEEVTRRGLRVVDSADGADAVVQGHSPDTGWRNLAEATLAIRQGALWVATNVDPTLPTDRGPMPGNGSMVGVVRIASGAEPQVAGKPAPTLIQEALRASGRERGLVVGDRLDTDIEGGNAAGLPTLVVLTGVSTPREVLEAPGSQRPTYLGANLGALFQPAEDLAPGSRDGWAVGDDLALSGEGDDLDALRALCAVHWAAGGGAARVRAEGDAARAAVDRLGLA
ncbi:HAD-IIA family hydrolase [Pseudonocardia halophobica]|uniref:Acid sugar phosphatase n=1 Tax=Pseudonocardia halophobica TaxID=29401 RepID=A0A9W6L5B7_9PSEU|nr:HAD-IIA family hydrolase [Pseudonocardia halophobica]GLL13952.1 acid sugar phosphatase [Pseudonocardia halophobica]